MKHMIDSIEYLFPNSSLKTDTRLGENHKFLNMAHKHQQCVDLMKDIINTRERSLQM